ncbi:MAG TPA: SelT/SelW/SelH family protein [Acidobacteriota bacterium]|nr:SelT/SelW/SelH family protein [Acidobacteriota bacterium]
MSENPSSVRTPRIAILYCTQCRWLLRAGWIAEELLTTFEEELGEVALIPSSGGTFDIYLDDQLLYSRKEEGSFPELKTLKQKIRDHIVPGRDLGHSDRKT